MIRADRFVYLYLLLVVAIVCNHVVLANDGSDSVLEMEHSLAVGLWESRGSVSVKIDHRNKNLKLSFSNPSTKLSSEQVSTFRNTLNENGFYKLRIKSASDSEWMIASIPSCLLSATKFREKLRFHMDKNGAISGFDFVHHDKNMDIKCTEKDFSTPDEIVIQSHASFGLPERVQSIPLNIVPSGMKGPIPGASPEAQAAAGGEQNGEGEKEEPGFLRKYWYYFIPLIVMQFLKVPAEQAGGSAGNAQADSKGAAKKQQ